MEDHDHATHTFVKVCLSTRCFGDEQDVSTTTTNSIQLSSLEQTIRDELAVLDAMKIYYLNTVLIAEATRLNEGRVRELMDKIMSANTEDREDEDDENPDFESVPIIGCLGEDVVVSVSSKDRQSLCKPSLTSQWPMLQMIANTDSDCYHELG